MEWMRSASRWRGGARGWVSRGTRPSVAVGVVALLTILLAASPARAQDSGLPVQLVVTVIAPKGAPRPTGRIVVSIDRRELLSLRLAGLEPLTALLPVLSVTLAALEHRVTVAYTGDANYEASPGIMVTVPTHRLLTIVALPRRDSTPPEIEVVSPAAGLRYDRDESVVAIYSCRDPDGRSAVTRCDGPVANGSVVDTQSDGERSFVVHAEDSAGNTASKTVTYAVGAGAAGAPAVDTKGSGGEDGPPGQEPAPAQQPVPAQQPAPAQLPPPTAAGVVATAVPALPAPAQAGGSPSAAVARGRRASSPSGTRARPARAAARASSAPPLASPTREAYAPYDPRAEPVKTIGILGAAFALLALASGGGLARSAGGSAGGARARSADRTGHHRHQSSAPSSSYEHGGVDYEFLAAGFGAVALGDRSRTWAWPGTKRLDRLNATIPVRVARRSPLLARVASDGTYLRATLGSSSLLGIVAGIALGILAIQNTGGDAAPPVLGLTIAMVMLGVFDAAAGLAAVLTFTIGVVMLGGVQSDGDARLMFGMSMLWFAVPLVAGLARPLRRSPARGLEASWDRAADIVIAGLIGAWATQNIVLALPGMAGANLPIAEHADAIALCALAAIGLRMGFETIAAHFYPMRLDLTEASDVPAPGIAQRGGALALRSAIYVYFAHLVVDWSWQLYVATAMFLLPQLLWLFPTERFPNSRKLFRALPKGWVGPVVLVFVYAAVGALLLSTMDKNSSTFLANCFVLFSVPYFVLATLGIFGREGDAAAIGWGKRVAGVVIIVAGTLQVLGLLF
ncbi:MAG: hypothetical protein QOG94_617 [Solirubrobacteraceae bacterium]|nr:hypothetical protein [Solirubrobacteraceae bacterium]